MGENGVGRIGHIRAVYLAAARNGQLVGQLGAALGDEQIVIPVFLVDVRSLWVTSARTLPQRLAVGQLLARLRVDLAQHDGVVGIAHHVALPVFEVERRVDALLFQPDRL